MRYILFLIAIFIHVDNVAVGPTCFFFLSSLFSSTHPKTLMWFSLSFFLSFILNVLRSILILVD